MEETQNSEDLETAENDPGQRSQQRIRNFRSSHAFLFQETWPVKIVLNFWTHSKICNDPFDAGHGFPSQTTDQFLVLKEKVVTYGDYMLMERRNSDALSFS